jgi:MoxR-like ATPase
VIVGQAAVIDQLLIAVLSGGHGLLTGAPGLAKTLLVKSLAQLFDLKFQRIQFTPDLMPADITGTEILQETEQGRRMTFVKGPVFANVILADEINRTPPKTQAALLEAMQEHHVTAAGVTHALEKPFFVLATQNPIEMEGTYPLPEAQLDRFFFKLRVLPPSRSDLHAILDRTTGPETPAIRRVLTRDRVMEMRTLIRQVPVARPIQDFVVRLIDATHPEASTLAEVKKFVRYGSSPRGAQAILLGAKVLALRAGRFSPSYGDVRAVAAQALRHRILLNFEGEADGISTDQILEAVLRTLPEE